MSASPGCPKTTTVRPKLRSIWSSQTKWTRRSSFPRRQRDPHIYKEGPERFRPFLLPHAGWQSVTETSSSERRQPDTFGELFAGALGGPYPPQAEQHDV